MGTEWVNQDRHQLEERFPKVLMVGELGVAIAGRKATILFLDDHVVFRFAD